MRLNFSTLNFMNMQKLPMRNGVGVIVLNNDNKVSGMANGKFWNPYRNEEQLGLLIFENILFIIKSTLLIEYDFFVYFS